jgi:hypothetical protein
MRCGERFWFVWRVCAVVATSIVWNVRSFFLFPRLVSKQGGATVENYLETCVTDEYLVPHGERFHEVSILPIVPMSMSTSVVLRNPKLTRARAAFIQFQI